MFDISDLLAADVFFNLDEVTVLEDQRLTELTFSLYQPLPQSLHTSLCL